MTLVMIARRVRGVALLALAAVAAGCQESSAPSAPGAAHKCTAVGQRCEFSPGKLGSCVLRDDCRGSDCYVCQSQH